MSDIIRKHCGCLVSPGGTTLEMCVQHKKTNALVSLSPSHVDESAAERRGFIKGLEAAKRIARKEVEKMATAVASNGARWVARGIAARIKREKAKR